MKFVVTTLVICLIVIITGLGCSKEEPPPPPENKTVVKKTIKRPTPEKAETERPVQEKSSRPEPQVTEETASEAAEADEDPVPGVNEEKGIYITEEGDTLASVAGKKDIFGDRIKWPVLYRLNREKYEQVTKDADLPYTELPEGTGLEIITPEQAEDNLKKKPEDLWAVNVLSSPGKDRVTVNVLNLIDKGYPTYITLIKVKGEDWMRVRVGFFNDRKTAEKKGEEIMEALKISDTWTAKAGEEERKEFGGYIP